MCVCGGEGGARSTLYTSQNTPDHQCHRGNSQDKMAGGHGGMKGNSLRARSPMRPRGED